jgi:hypothetical protein
VSVPKGAVPESEYSYHPLAGAVAKFNHSKQQFDLLRSEIGEFFEQDPMPHHSRGYFDPSGWEWIERFQVRELPPLRFGVTLGDCLHNLRSALDHLICQLTLLDGGTMADCEQTQYPIASKSEGQFERMADHRIPKLSRHHRAMVKRTQPYRAGEDAAVHPLFVLAELSNADKHRVLNPTFSVMKSDAAEVLEGVAGNFQGDGPDPAKSWWMLDRGGRLEHGTPWLRIGLDRAILTERPQVEIGGLLRTGLAFGDMGMDADSYRHIAEYVRKILEIFTRRFPETKYIDSPAE